MFRSKAVLFIRKDGVGIKMVHNMGVNDVFKDLTSYGGEGNGTVIGCVSAISFFEYGGDICTQPG